MSPSKARPAPCQQAAFVLTSFDHKRGARDGALVLGTVGLGVGLLGGLVLGGGCGSDACDDRFGREKLALEGAALFGLSGALLGGVVGAIAGQRERYVFSPE